MHSFMVLIGKAMQTNNLQAPFPVTVMIALKMRKCLNSMITTKKRTLTITAIPMEVGL
jgi:hypothetical protein